MQATETTKMNDAVAGLRSLQEIDHAIQKAEGDLTGLSEDLAQLQESVEELEARVTRVRGELEAADTAVRSFHRAVEAGRATLKRLETRAAGVQNVQQHLAVRTETDTARRNLRAAEDDQLDAMQDVETAREALAAAESELTAAQAKLDERAAEAGARRDALNKQLAEQSARRGELENGLDARTMEVYRKAGGGGKRDAMAALTADGVCGKCFTAVPRQRQAEIRAGRSLAVCEGCGIILYPVDPDD